MAKIQITELPQSEIELAGEIPAAEFEKHRPAALANLNRESKLDGFRPGHVPEAVLAAKLGEETILREMAELALAAAYPDLIQEHNLAVIGRPEISLTKLASGNPLGFKIKTAVTPRFTLPDYRAIATEVNALPTEALPVTDKEVDELLEQIRRERTNPETKEAPTLDDAFAQTLGEFKTLVELRERLRDNLQREKEHKARDKKRLQIMDALIAKSEIPLPPVLIESEIDRMEAELKSEVERIGLKFPDYLAHLKKTEAELREAWKEPAEKRLKTNLLIEKIATAEKLAPVAEEIQKEVAHLKTHYPEAADDRLAAYVTGVLTAEQCWHFLEEQK